MKKIDPTGLQENVIRMIGRRWMLITAGTVERFNTMTASWGGIGFLWNRPVAFVFIRPERYTYEFTEGNDRFTLSFFGEEYRKALQLCGTVSGRTTDKVKEAGLTPYAPQKETVAFTQADTVIECRKLYASFLDPEAFVDPEPLGKWYASEGIHKMYIAEIETVWKR